MIYLLIACPKYTINTPLNTLIRIYNKAVVVCPCCIKL